MQNPITSKLATAEGITRVVTHTDFNGVIDVTRYVNGDKGFTRVKEILGATESGVIAKVPGSERLFRLTAKGQDLFYAALVGGPKAKDTFANTVVAAGGI